MDNKAFLQAVVAAGIVGEGGAGFPSHVKYNAKAEIVIANGCECEPLLHTDQHHMLHNADAIVKGILAVKQSVGATKAVIALKRKHKEATAILTKAIGSQDVTLALLDNFYPAGDEHILVREITGRSVPPLGLPLHVGVVVANVGTLVGVVNAIEGKAATQKILTITGDVKKPGIVNVPVGTSMQACLDAAGGASIADPVFILGGPMMGRMVDSADAFADEYVTKTSGGLIVIPRGHPLHINARLPVKTMRRRAAAACIQCRMCSDLCPRQLIGHPFETHRVMQAFASNAELTSPQGALAALCCDCGICEQYACPMGLSPRRINQAVKNSMRAAGISYTGSKEIIESATKWREYRRVPVPRLAARIGITKYMDLPCDDLGTLSPKTVTIALRQHIGAPASPVVKVGDRVKTGDVIGEIPADALGARVHASIDGTVRSVDAYILIER